MTTQPDSKAHVLLRFSKPILFLIVALCLAGAYSGYTMPSSVFPQTDFPRVVILIDNGVMPGDEMMATVTRPVEESMKDIPGAINIRSTTGRGSAAINVFFDWSTDMTEAEQYVLGRLSQIQSTLPPTASVQVHRLTFSAFPILGISLTSDTRQPTDLWETARYDIYPRFLRIRGVARVKLVGGRVPEYHVVVDPTRLDANGLSFAQVTQALADTNLFTPAGMHEENYQLYLTTVDNRLHTAKEIEDVILAWVNQAPVRVRDVATVETGSAPQFNRVTADAKEAVLLNIYGQPDCNTVQIAEDLHRDLEQLKKELPPDMKMAFFYDQSQFVREGVQSVWDAIILGLILSVVVLFVFLRSWRATLVAAMVIPVTVLLTLIGMKLLGMSFNLMTLGGIAAVVGIVIDDAIVVVEAIYAKVESGERPTAAVKEAIAEVGPALVGSTLTPVVVFIPLAFLDGVAGVFFRALATTMVIALLISLLLAVTWTPVTAGLLIRARKQGWLGPLIARVTLRFRRSRSRQTLDEPKNQTLASSATKHSATEGGPILRGLTAIYAAIMRVLLRWSAVAMIGIVVIAAGGGWIYLQLESDFLPAQDEGAFVIDYFSRPGTSLTETNRMLMHVEAILHEVPEIEGFSRRTGARLAFAIAEPNTGDFLVKLKPNRNRTTAQVIEEVRAKANAAEPALQFEFPGVLGDLIGDLTWSPNPVEIKLYSTNIELLKAKAAEIAQTIEAIPGVVDVNDGLVVAGPTLRLKTNVAEAARVGLTPRALGNEIQATMLGTVSSYVLHGDRIYNVRVMASPQSHSSQQELATMPLRTLAGANMTVRDVAQIEHEPGMLEMHREDLRQLVSVSARFENIDMGSGISEIKKAIASKVQLPPEASMEFGGLYQQQQESFRNLALVLAMALVLVFGVLILEFRGFMKPIAILAGSILAMFGVAAALWLTGTTLNIISFLGAIIGIGITAKNGILMLDYVDQLMADGLPLDEALIQSGRRRLRPVLMTSLTTFLGLLPLAYGVGAGADMLRPMAIAVIGSLCMSLVLALIATPVFYYLMVRIANRIRRRRVGEQS
ncbi:Cobalt-zinc-cadmium resistance protein CzcA [Stieleria neptunia]|uniref:Cobalt-zinc-cadmium resistance protein CzcA n=1 Tax=Stieleria neptunia TaxID=2527979 RepID=A0A518I395_9BACT|nr:efflux RND transporter permease subunit [Stieleria neptunia]QDV47575.1 Cobalt-zinc-cadmium resistance protein CzcA [Stieleria neptunia]